MTYLSVRNLERHQHYKDRSPPWIKLHRETLDDYEFGQLSDAHKGHLMLIWLLASACDNRLPDDPQWIASRIEATTPVDVEVLITAGFLERHHATARRKQAASKTLAARKQNARLVEERRGETEESAPAAPSGVVSGDAEPDGFAACWAAYPRRAGGNPRGKAIRAYRARLAAGVPVESLLAGVARYAAYCERTGKLGSEYVKQAATFFGPEDFWAEPWDDPPFAPARKPPAPPPRPVVVQDGWFADWGDYPAERSLRGGYTT